MLDSDCIAHPALRGLHDHWRSLAPVGVVPGWRAFDPVAVVPCIGWILVADIVQDPFGVRYRLVGERLTALYGRELTGRDLESLYLPDFRARVLDAYQAVVIGRAPRYEMLKFYDLPGKYDYHRLMLPFTRSGDAVDIVMVGIFPADPQLRHADHWRRDAVIREFVEQLEALGG